MEIDNDNDLEVKISQSESELKELNNEINQLLIEIEKPKMEMKMIEEMNKELESIHISNKEDISRYKDQIKELNKKKEMYDEQLLNLKKENEELKLKNNIDNKIEEKEIENITNLNTLSKSLGFKIENDNDNQNEGKNNNLDEQKNNKDIEIKILEEILKTKADYEVKFTKLKEKCNEYNKVKEQQKIIINNHKDYLEDMNQNMNIYFNELNNSSNNNNENENIINENKTKNLDDIYIQIDKISYLISKIEQIHFDIKTLFGINIENLLEEIQQNLNNIDNKKYNNEETLKKMIDNIKHRIEEIENICFIFEENKNNFIDKNKIIEKEINILSEEFILIDEQKDINDNEWLNNNNIKAEKLNAQTGNSSLFITKNISGKYDSRNLFKEGKEDLIENNTQKSKLLFKNWHQICYIYDDYDLHDIYYDVKVVGLPENEHTKVQQYYFDTSSIIEVQKYSVDGKESEYIFNNNYINFKLELSNLQSARIHLVFKKTKDLNKLSQAQKEIRKFFREEEYGLGKNLAGQIAKFSLILKGNFDIVRFDDYFFVRNKKNLSETEYTWGGVVPNEGRKTYILLSKIQANWLFHFSITFNSNNYIKDTILYSPIQFIGGNNEIIKINASSKQTKNIILNDESRIYILKYKNINIKKVNL